MSKNHKCKSSYRWVKDKTGELNLEDRENIRVSVPEQFGGDPEHVDPEILLAGAVNSCMGVTFFGNLKRAGIEVEDLEVEATGDYGKGPSGLEFKNFEVEARVKPAPEQDKDELQQAISDWGESCLVTETLNVPVDFEAKIV